MSFSVINARQASLHDAWNHRWHSIELKRHPYAMQQSYGNGKDYHFSFEKQKKNHLKSLVLSWSDGNGNMCLEKKRVFSSHWFRNIQRTESTWVCLFLNKQTKYIQCISHETFFVCSGFINLSAWPWFMLLFSEIGKQKIHFLFFSVRRYANARTSHTSQKT